MYTSKYYGVMKAAKIARQSVLTLQPVYTRVGARRFTAYYKDLSSN